MGARGDEKTETNSWSDILCNYDSDKKYDALRFKYHLTTFG